MRVLGINALPNGSPAMIMREILNEAEQEINAQCVSYYGNWKNTKASYLGSNRFGFKIENLLNAGFSRLTGYQNCLSIFGTIYLIRRIKRFNPDIIHLHNLHLWVINLPLLFNYIKKHNIKVVWTLHDCWAFTGQCPYFTMVKCSKWKKGCHNCPQINVYPSTKVDHTQTMWRLKKKWFTGINNMTIVSPSEWLANLAKQSNLKEYPIVVINNGIDLEIFKPTESDFRKKYHLENKKIILGVALGWNKRKGLDVFIELSNRLDSSFQIILVGTDSETDKKLPKKIISIHRTSSQKELAEVYSAADLFVNPTREENYPTVNMESIACGTPVLTFRTGGSPEIPDSKSGYVVDVDNIDEMEKQIKRICHDMPFKISDCLSRARQFNCKSVYQEYVDLYKKINRK